MNCPKFGFEINDNLKQSYCKNCDGCQEVKPCRYLNEAIDIFKLAKGLKSREQKEKVQDCCNNLT